MSPVAYMLELPAVMKIHPVIHVCRLKPYFEDLGSFPLRPKPDVPPQPELDGSDELYHVEAFLNHRGTGTNLQYLVKWLGYPDHENVWVKASGLKKDLGAVYFNKMVAEYQAVVKHRSVQRHKRLNALSVAIFERVHVDGT